MKSQDYDNVTLILLLFKFHYLLLTSFCFKDEHVIYSIYTFTMAPCYLIIVLVCVYHIYS